jgi:O-methyltransferase involved in polyketide biosynthesis
VLIRCHNLVYSGKGGVMPKPFLMGEQETLLIPLYCKAKKNNPILADKKAQEILQQVDYKFSALDVPAKTCAMILLRANKLDEYARAFLAEHPDSLVLHLGCGLDARYDRLQPKQAMWIDLDLPDVIELRRQFFDETDRVRMIGSSVTDLGWLDEVGENGRTTLIIAEGLLMYLSGSDVKALTLALHERFPGSHFIFDAFSKMTADSAGHHPSLKKTGATVQWGINDPHTIETWAEGIHFKEEWAFSDAPEVDTLPFGLRLGFKAGGMFQFAKQAHRILYYTL